MTQRPERSLERTLKTIKEREADWTVLTPEVIRACKAAAGKVSKPDRDIVYEYEDYLQWCYEYVATHPQMDTYYRNQNMLIKFLVQRCSEAHRVQWERNQTHVPPPWEENLETEDE